MMNSGCSRILPQYGPFGEQLSHLDKSDDSVTVPLSELALPLLTIPCVIQAGMMTVTLITSTPHDVRKYSY
jgi:hypothetical protein